MCNCSKPKPNRPRPAGSGTSTKQDFSLTSNDGRTQTFGSKLEADAANARSGYAGRVRPA